MSVQFTAAIEEFSRSVDFDMLVRADVLKFGVVKFVELGVDEFVGTGNTGSANNGGFCFSSAFSAFFLVLSVPPSTPPMIIKMARITTITNVFLVSPHTVPRFRPFFLLSFPNRSSGSVATSGPLSLLSNPGWGTSKAGWLYSRPGGVSS